MSICVPDGLSDIIRRRQGQAGIKWLNTLPALTEKLCRQWDLRLDGAPMYGSSSLIVPVRRGMDDFVLKMAWPHWKSRTEARALSVWAGVAAVQLVQYEADHDALLLERLDENRSLNDLPSEAAAAVAGTLIRRLATSDPGALPSVAELSERWSVELPAQWYRLGCPGEPRHMREAATAAAELARSSRRLVVNQDLHYSNVLAATRAPWLVIDPKALVGDAEFAVCPLLWNRFSDMDDVRGLHRRVSIIIDAGGLDAQLTLAWSRVRAVEYWLWSLERGETVEAERAAELISWLSSAPLRNIRRAVM